MSIAGAIIAGVGPAVLDKVAPALWARLKSRGKGSAIEEVAEIVESIARDTLGLPADAGPEQARLALAKADPAAYVKLQQMAHEQVLKALEADMHYATLEQRDKESARELYAHGERGPQNTLVAMAFALALIAFATIAYMDYIDKEPSDVLISLATSMIGVLIIVFQFFFGSSLGSKLKG